MGDSWLHILFESVFIPQGYGEKEKPYIFDPYYEKLAN